MIRINRSAFVPYGPGQMFDLVNDVAAYPEFLPWCADAAVIEQAPGHMKARLKVEKGRLNYAFTTANRLDPGRAIDLELVDGPFRRFAGGWRFEPLEDGCMVSLALEFEFSSRVLGKLMTAAFRPIADSLVDAFRKRAISVYGV